jgi:hypothetical protein
MSGKQSSLKRNRREANPVEEYPFQVVCVITLGKDIVGNVGIIERPE